MLVIRKIQYLCFQNIIIMINGGKDILLRFFAICFMLLYSFELLSAQTKRAFVVGISEYPQSSENAWATIHGANDADLIASVLKKQGFRITKLCDKAATANKIRREMASLVASCRKGDVVYLHFSCHGQPFEDLNGDEEDGWDESIIPYDALMTYTKGKYEGANHITDDELHSFFLQLRKAVGINGFVSVVIDACHAGGSSRGDDELEEDEDEFFVRGTKKGFSPRGREFRPRINSRGNFQIPQETGMANIAIIEACRSYQSNYEIKQSAHYYGPLSYYVCQVLTRKNISANLDWILEVKRLMDSDRRLTRQNMVYETSLK